MRVEEMGRPSLGPLFGVACAAWCAVLLVEHLSWAAYVEGGPALPSSSLAGIAVAMALLVGYVLLQGRSSGGRGRLSRAACAAAISFAAVALCAGLHWSSWAQQAAAAEELPSDAKYLCALVSDASERDYGVVSTARVEVEGHTCSLRLLWPRDAAPLAAGHAVRVRGSLSVPEDDAGGRWNHQQGHVGMLVASSVEDAGPASGLQGLVAPFRDACVSRLQEHAGAGAALLAGVLLGCEVFFEGSELERDFQTTGLAHLMAVSGSHLAIVTVLLGWVFARTPLGRAPRAAVLGTCLFLYAVLTCMAPSAIRSCIMCLVALCAPLAHRRAHVLSALALCVLVFCAANPPLVFSIGFQLSVLAVGGLALFGSLARMWAVRLLPQRAVGLADGIAATLAASVPTLPVTVPLFAQVPLVSPLANLLVGPLVTFMLVLGLPALLVTAVVPALAGPLLGVLGALAGVCAWLVHGLADLPGACLPADAGGVLLGPAVAVCLGILWAAWPRPPARDAFRAGSDAGVRNMTVRAVLFAMPAVFLLAFLLVSDAERPRVVMMDVGQGDCMLVRDGGVAVLVDTGADERLLVQGLARQGVAHLDAVFITHKDDDHCGALSALAGVVGVDHVYVHEDLVNDEALADVERAARWVTGRDGLEGVSAGTCARIGAFSLTVLAPADGGRSGNEDSLVGLLEYDAQGDGVPEARGFLTGDAEAPVTAGVAAKVGDVDFLKVAHHGSRDAVTADELSCLQPQVALIGVGAENGYGHPTRETLQLLEACHAKVYRTDLDGDIVLDFSAAGMGISTQRR